MAAPILKRRRIAGSTIPIKEPSNAASRNRLEPTRMPRCRKYLDDLTCSATPAPPTVGARAHKVKQPPRRGGGSRRHGGGKGARDGAPASDARGLPPIGEAAAANADAGGVEAAGIGGVEAGSAVAGGGGACGRWPTG